MEGDILGIYNRIVDAKGRFVIPSSFKHIPGEKMVVILREDYIEVKEYKKVIEELNRIKLSLQNVDSIDIINFYQDKQDLLTANIINVVKFDTQGRFLLGVDLLKKYELTNQIVIEGVVDSFRVWHPDKFEEYRNNVNKRGRK